MQNSVRVSFFVSLQKVVLVMRSNSQRLESLDALRGFDMMFIMGVASLVSESVEKVILATGYVLICWLILYFLYRKEVFLKV